MFERCQWNENEMRMGDLRFRLMHFKKEDWFGGDHFGLYKLKTLFDQYEYFFSSRPQFEARNILELGLWDGGSLAIWCEVFQPEKIVGIDLYEREDSDYFRKYVSSRNLSKTVNTYWGVDQADTAQVETIIAREFDGSLDLVIDDASHLYFETKACFEAVFPHLRPGGLYIIEDWAWAHWPEFDDNPYFSDGIALTQLIIEIAEMIGSAREQPPAILTVMPGFAAIEKGALMPEDGRCDLDRLITRRPDTPKPVRFLA